jgi:molecular chaperone HtpG
MTDATDSATIEATGPAESHGFTADVSRLLEMMAHSVYSEREVFLRELVSNAADACEKLRHEALTDAALAQDAGAPLVVIALDKDKRTLTVTDNGVGMSRDDLISALGSIANSGTRAFLERIKSDDAASGAGGSLIGQFGVGFYSVFMVSDKVEVLTRRAGSAEAFLWTSDGKGAYDIASADVASTPKAGTRVTLHINAESDEFLDKWRVESALREHSGAIAIPVDLIGAPGEEPQRLSDGVALWAKSKSDISDEDYADFYRQLSGQFDEPALTIHWRAEGRYEYTVLAFVPGSRPLDLFDPMRKSRAKLYVRRVLISKDVELLPNWLRFVRLVVDSADLPLNVSREVAQQSAALAAIGKAAASRIAQEISKLADSDPEKFAALWENFGPVIKEGLHEDPSRRDDIFKIARFASTASAEKTRTLKDYVDALRPNQTAIYYIVGDDKKRIAQSPQLEDFKARGVEVLLLDDSVDAFWVTSAVGFDGKPFKSATQGENDLSAVPLKEGETDAPPPETTEEVAELIALMKSALEEHVAEVRASTRLRESAVCLIAPEFALDRQLARLLAAHGQADATPKPILEINAGHPAIRALAQKAKSGERQEAEDGCFLLLDMARVADGEPPVDAAAFARRLSAQLARGAE